MDNTLYRAIELCLAAYRITDKFPHEEILTRKIRAKSIDIIEDLVYSKAIPTDSSRIFICENLRQKIRTLFAYFAVAEKQGWVGGKNFRILEKAYRDFYRMAKLTDADAKLSGSRPSGTADSRINPGINAGIKRREPSARKQQPRLTMRQEKILEFLRGKDGGTTISDVAGIIGLSNKTVERELKKMIAIRLVQKQGNTKGARFIMDK